MITLDNSAISSLYCERQYELKIKRGLHKDEEDSPALDFGNALHKALEYQANGDDLDAIFVKVFQAYPKIDTAKLVKSVGAIITSSNANPPITLANNKPAIEVKFNYLYESDVTLCGTIDRIEQDDDTLVIKDYKSAGDATDYKIKEKLNLYNFSFQLPFYVHCLLTSGILPAQHLAQLREGRYRTEYTVIFFNATPAPVVKAIKFPPYPDEYIYNEVPKIIQLRLEQARRIHGDNSRAAMTGLNVYAGCKYCDFQRACSAAGTEAEQEILGRFNVKQYDPMSFR